jgi:protein subunit release factor A
VEPSTQSGLKFSVTMSDVGTEILESETSSWAEVNDMNQVETAEDLRIAAVPHEAGVHRAQSVQATEANENANLERKSLW